MHCLKDIGLAEYYYLDNDKIYSDKKKGYIKESSRHKYKLVAQDGKPRSITLKEIYKRLYNEVYCKDNIEKLEGEVFKEIEGTEGKYLVSNMGRVCSKTGYEAIILKPTITQNGYERVQLVIHGHKYNKLVHCLVAAAFLEKPNSLDYEVHHKTFNKLDNRAEALAYVSKIDHKEIHKKRSKEPNGDTT